MGFSKTEVNLVRLLEVAPKQQNQAKLMHYISTLREQLEQLAEEKTPEGLPKISKAKLNEYSEKIEDIASKLSPPMASTEPSSVDLVEEIPTKPEGQKSISPSHGLRRRPVPVATVEDKTRDISAAESSASVKLDASGQAHIEKHRKLQEDLTEEMVVLARQLKESNLLMSQSVQNTEKILDSTEKAIEHSLASTGRANVRAMDIYSKTSTTSCFTWLVMFLMTCMFIMVVLLIRIT